MIACGASGSDQPAPGNKQKPVSAATTAESPTPEPAAAPLPADFRITVKELSKQCFGEAGCNITFRIDVAYGGTPLPEDKEYRVVYTVTGDTSGPQKNSFTLRGEQVEYPSEEYASTRTSAVKLVAKVTEVLEN